MVFLGPVDAKVALLNGSVDARATWEPYTTQMVKTNEGRSGERQGLLPGIPSSRQRIPRLTIRKTRRAAGLSPARPAPSAGPTPISTATANVGEIIRFPAEIARAQFANRQSQWQPLAEETVAQQQATADFYLANGLIRTRLDVKPTLTAV